jgi:periplasmic divalent cation tolerance protein
VNPKSDHLVVLVTAPLLPVARKLAGKILSARLAACVNLLPAIESHYRWQGKIERGGEVLMLVKTRREKLKDLRRLIKRHHPYETPEIIALPIVGGSKKYLKWIDESLQ